MQDTGLKGKFRAQETFMFMNIMFNKVKHIA